MRRSLAAAFAAVLFAGLCHAASDEQKKHAYDVIDRNAEATAIVGDSLFYFGELGMQEHESAKFLKQTLEGIGFKVEVGGAGMPTNVWAQWGSGKPKIVIVTEIDALPEGSQDPRSFPRKPLVAGAPGHMEGHNTHGAVAIAAAHALKQTMERYNLPGTVALSFGPAEEQLISRPFLVRAGYFKDADAAILVHIGDNMRTTYGYRNYAAISAKFTFHGKTAHGAVAPWEGRDALDAVELMSIGFDKLREHLRPTYRGHRTITMGGIQPNVIPDLAQIWWYVRDASGPAAKENFDTLVNIGTLDTQSQRYSSWWDQNGDCKSESGELTAIDHLLVSVRRLVREKLIDLGDRWRQPRQGSDACDRTATACTTRRRTCPRSIADTVRTFVRCV